MEMRGLSRAEAARRRKIINNEKEMEDFAYYKAHCDATMSHPSKRSLARCPKDKNKRRGLFHLRKRLENNGMSISLMEKTSCDRDNIKLETLQDMAESNEKKILMEARGDSGGCGVETNDEAGDETAVSRGVKKYTKSAISLWNMTDATYNKGMKCKVSSRFGDIAFTKSSGMYAKGKNSDKGDTQKTAFLSEPAPRVLGDILEVSEENVTRLMRRHSCRCFSVQFNAHN